MSTINRTLLITIAVLASLCLILGLFLIASLSSSGPTQSEVIENAWRDNLTVDSRQVICDRYLTGDPDAVSEQVAYLISEEYEVDVETRVMDNYLFGTC